MLYLRSLLRLDLLSGKGNGGCFARKGCPPTFVLGSCRRLFGVGRFALIAETVHHLLGGAHKGSQSVDTGNDGFFLAGGFFAFAQARLVRFGFRFDHWIAFAIRLNWTSV